MDFGKFKDAESLLRSYENLEREFTKRCQELAKYKAGEGHDGGKLAEEEKKQSVDDFACGRLDKVCPPEPNKCSFENRDAGKSLEQLDPEEANVCKTFPKAENCAKLQTIFEDAETEDTDKNFCEEGKIAEINENERVLKNSEANEVKKGSVGFSDPTAVEKENGEKEQGLCLTDKENGEKEQGLCLTDQKIDQLRQVGVMDYIKRVLDKKSNAPRLLTKAGKGERLIYQSEIKSLASVKQAGDYVLKNYF